MPTPPNTSKDSTKQQELVCDGFKFQPVFTCFPSDRLFFFPNPPVFAKSPRSFVGPTAPASSASPSRGSASTRGQAR